MSMKKSWKKAKEKLRQFTSRSRCGSIVRTMKKIKVYMRGWLNYYGIADMKNNIESMNGWLYRRIRMCIWKQWKLPKTRKKKADESGLTGMGSLRGSIQPEILLAHGGKRSGTKSANERKTDKLGLL